MCVVRAADLYAYTMVYIHIDCGCGPVGERGVYVMPYHGDGSYLPQFASMVTGSFVSYYLDDYGVHCGYDHDRLVHLRGEGATSVVSWFCEIDEETCLST